MRIEIVEYESRRQTDSIDTNLGPCFGYRVLLVNGDKRSVLFENDQFDVLYRNVRGTREQYRSEAQKKAVEISDAVGCTVDLKPVPEKIALQPGYYCVKVKSCKVGFNGFYDIEADWENAKRVESNNNKLSA